MVKLGREGLTDFQKEIVFEFLRLDEEIVDTRIQPERRLEEIFIKMAGTRNLPLTMFKYLLRENAKSVLSAIEKKETDITLTENQTAALQEVIEVLKRICGHCGGEGETHLGEGLQKEVCPMCKGAGETEPEGIDAEEFEKY